MMPEEIETELERLHGAGFAWAMACCGRSREEAQDVLQTSYLKILDGRAAFAGRSSFQTFLFGVIRRTASEARRRNAVRGVLLGQWARQKEQPVLEAAPEERLALAKALARLPRRQRQVLVLVFSHGLTVDEAARTLGVSAGSARVHYARAKQRLHELMGGKERG
jgi:RNA polymerase sigma factor (sigma-70 family)